MRLLIIGQLDGYVATAGKIALAKGAKVSHIETLEGALNALRKGQGADLILVDVRQDVGALMAQLTRERFSLPVIACGIGTEPEIAVRAIEAGAQDYLPLPPDPELIGAILHTLTYEETKLFFEDPKMQSLMTLAQQVAQSEASILITGESGTGKEVLARFIHSHSRRCHHPFVSLNCAAIPDTLLESELFGHEKGAFTGAVGRRIGKFEEANGGTLLLDEITEMDIRLQPKLLRALQERVIDRIGGGTPVKVNIRVLATSNRNMQEAVKEKKFREDLYFRLNVVTLHLPPLRERPRDISLLSRHFVSKYAKLNGFEESVLSEAALKKLMAHSWPGNVRELENTIHRAVILSGGEPIGAEVLLLEDTSSSISSPTTVGRSLAEVEKELILSTVNHYTGNRTQAAQVLGISIRTLRNKLKEYGQVA